VAYHLPPVGLPAFPAICLLIVPVEISSLPIPSSRCAFSFPPLPLCASFQFAVYCSVFLGCVWCQSAQGVMLVYPGMAGGIPRDTWRSLVWSANVSQAALEPAAAAYLFSECNVAWRSFLWARGSGCWSFDSPWCFISAKCGSSITARFESHRAHSGSAP
jgi:hypothetical protein